MMYKCKIKVHIVIPVICVPNHDIIVNTFIYLGISTIVYYKTLHLYFIKLIYNA